MITFAKSISRLREFIDADSAFGDLTLEDAELLLYLNELFGRLLALVTNWPLHPELIPETWDDIYQLDARGEYMLLREIVYRLWPYLIPIPEDLPEFLEGVSEEERAQSASGVTTEYASIAEALGMSVNLETNIPLPPEIEVIISAIIELALILLFPGAAVGVQVMIFAILASRHGETVAFFMLLPLDQIVSFVINLPIVQGILGFIQSIWIDTGADLIARYIGDWINRNIGEIVRRVSQAALERIGASSWGEALDHWVGFYGFGSREELERLFVSESDAGAAALTQIPNLNPTAIIIPQNGQLANYLYNPYPFSTVEEYQQFLRQQGFGTEVIYTVYGTEIPLTLPLETDAVFQSYNGLYNNNQLFRLYSGRTYQEQGAFTIRFGISWYGDYERMTVAHFHPISGQFFSPTDIAGTFMNNIGILEGSTPAMGEWFTFIPDPAFYDQLGNVPQNLWDDVNLELMTQLRPPSGISFDRHWQIVFGGRQLTDPIVITVQDATGSYTVTATGTYISSTTP